MALTVRPEPTPNPNAIRFALSSRKVTIQTLESSPPTGWERLTEAVRPSARPLGVASVISAPVCAAKARPPRMVSTDSSDESIFETSSLSRERPSRSISDEE